MAHPPVSAALEEIKPYVLTVAAVALFGAPAEIAVPVVRRVRGQSGVSVTPGLTNVVNEIVALAVVHYFRQRPAQWQRRKRNGVPAWGRIAGLGYLVLSPAAAARCTGGVLFRSRTPLWGAVISPIGLLQVTLLLVALGRARRARPPERAGARKAARADSRARQEM